MDTNLSDNLLKSARTDEKRGFRRDGVTPSLERALVALLEARSNRCRCLQGPRRREHPPPLAA